MSPWTEFQNLRGDIILINMDQSNSVRRATQSDMLGTDPSGYIVIDNHLVRGDVADVSLALGADRIMA